MPASELPFSVSAEWGAKPIGWYREYQRPSRARDRADVEGSAYLHQQSPDYPQSAPRGHGFRGEAYPIILDC